ncbi:MAG: hypothetical protein OXG56_02615 [Gammaproteobacteria bacterium]|nr:hypothetical protein [Gammaproteobacteria bacterium]
MAKGNDGNYLQHCVEVEAAVRLVQADRCGRLHVALTHGMEPFEKLEESNVQQNLLYDALDEAFGEPKCTEREIVKAYRSAYRSSKASRQHYPNTAELLRKVIGTNRLSGGITEVCQTKHKKLAEAWSDSNVEVAHSSWRKQLEAKGVLHCPDSLNAPWLFSMDPMRYSEGGRQDDDRLHRSDFSLLDNGLSPYFSSGQPGIACLFVYGMGRQNENPQRQFWAFMDDLARRMDATTGSYWVQHNGGNRNLAGLLFSDQELAWGFAPPRIRPGRGRKRTASGMQAESTRQGPKV